MSSMKKGPFATKKKDDWDEYEKMYEDIVVKKGGIPNQNEKDLSSQPSQPSKMNKFGLKPFEDVEETGGNPFKKAGVFAKPNISLRSGKAETQGPIKATNPIDDRPMEDPIQKEISKGPQLKMVVRKRAEERGEDSQERFQDKSPVSKEKGGKFNESQESNKMYEMRTSAYFSNPLKRGVSRGGSRPDLGGFEDSTSGTQSTYTSSVKNDKPNFDSKVRKENPFEDSTTSTQFEDKEKQLRGSQYSKPFIVKKTDFKPEIKDEPKDQPKPKPVEPIKTTPTPIKKEEIEKREPIPSAGKGSKKEDKKEDVQPKKGTKQKSDEIEEDYENDFEEPPEEYDEDFEEDTPTPVKKPEQTYKADKKILENKLVIQKPSEPEEKPAVFNKPAGFTKLTEKKDVYKKVETPTKSVAKEEEEEEEQYEPIEIANKEINKESFTEVQNHAQFNIMYIDDEIRRIQLERVKYLREFLSLEYETFDNLLDINPSSEFELYVNRINSGAIKNSNDQTNDEADSKETQTEEEFQRDISNQWPEDKNQTILQARDPNLKFLEEKSKEVEAPENTRRVIEFVKNVYPIIDEMLTYQEKNTISKDKINNFPMYEDIIRFPQELMDVFQDPTILCAFDSGANTSFISYAIKLSLDASTHNLGLIIEYSNTRSINYFLALCPVTSLYISTNFRHALIGGTKDGSLLLWDLRDSTLVHSKNSHEMITKIKAKEEGKYEEKYVYRLPNYSTDYLGENGHSSAVMKIKDVYSSKNIYEIFSMEEFGKVIVWNLTELTKYELSQGIYDLGMHVDAKIKLIKTTEFVVDDFYFFDLKQNVLCTDIDMDKQAANVFICTAKGVAKADKLGTPKPPRTYEDEESGGKSLCISVTATEFFYVGNSDGAFRIFSKDFSNPVLNIGNFTKAPIVDIIVPKYYPITLRNPSKYLEQLMRPIVFDKEGNIYFFELDKSLSPIHVENVISKQATGKTFKLLHKWFESNLDLHLIYSVDKSSIIHVNFNCSKVLDSTHEPIMKKNNNVSSIFKIVL